MMMSYQKEPPSLGAGFRYSSYGPPYNPGPQYWVDVSYQMSEKYSGAVPRGIWITGILSGQGIFVGFPTGIQDKYVQDFPVDSNAETLDLFDELGVQVWLQIEPGMAPVEELIHALLRQYGYHPCVSGVGIDVEWYQSYETPEGQAITDEVAKNWINVVKSHGTQYRLFLKHWETRKLPPTYRDGIVFIDDSQGFKSLNEMLSEFEEWGKHFYPSPVGFQFGYPRDKTWWKELEEPPGIIGKSILEAVSNTEGLYWVDFTVFDVFPPPK
jgi:hypothetical protein